MKHNLRGVILLFIGILPLSFFSCKSNSSSEVKTDTAVVAPAIPDNTRQSTPDTLVVISGNDSLRNMLQDALKDFPGVTSTVDDGIVTLTGNIDRSKLPQLMKSVSALHPKKIQNNLTIK